MRRAITLTLSIALLGIFAGVVVAAVNPSDGASTLPAASTGATDERTTTSPEDISGPCDETEHAGDPRCTGVGAAGDAGRVDNSGPGDVNSGRDDDGFDDHGDDDRFDDHGGDDDLDDRGADDFDDDSSRSGSGDDDSSRSGSASVDDDSSRSGSASVDDASSGSASVDDDSSGSGSGADDSSRSGTGGDDNSGHGGGDD